MKISVAPLRRDDDEHLIPLINIVFLLLIFFMLAGSFVRPDPFAVAPPQALSSASAQASQLVVLLAADGRLAIGEQEVDQQELRRLIGEQLSAQPDLQVQLKADSQLAAQLLIEIMDLLRATGVEKIMLLTALEDM